MADFNKYAPKLKKLEGGFVNDPSDKGRATNKGVTLATYRHYYGNDKTVQDLKNITDAQWSHIMKTGYWDLVRGDEIRNQSIAEIFADWAVNSGTSGIRAFQRAQGLKVDGIVGPRTLEVLNSPNEIVVFNRIKSNRESFYRKLAMTNPTQYKFLNGWLARLRAFQYAPLLLVLFMLTSCGPAKQVATETKIKVIEHTEFVPMMVYTDIPELKEIVRVKTDSSHLENKYAVSDAVIKKDGSLFHSLATKPQKVPQIIETPVVYKDSLVYVDKIETIEVPAQLNWWQQFRLKGFWALLGLVMIRVLIWVGRVLK